MNFELISAVADTDFGLGAEDTPGLLLLLRLSFSTCPFVYPFVPLTPTLINHLRNFTHYHSNDSSGRARADKDGYIAGRRMITITGQLATADDGHTRTFPDHSFSSVRWLSFRMTVSRRSRTGPKTIHRRPQVWIFRSTLRFLYGNYDSFHIGATSDNKATGLSLAGPSQLIQHGGPSEEIGLRRCSRRRHEEREEKSVAPVRC